MGDFWHRILLMLIITIVDWWCPNCTIGWVWLWNSALPVVRSVPRWRFDAPIGWRIWDWCLHLSKIGHIGRGRGSTNIYQSAEWSLQKPAADEGLGFQTRSNKHQSAQLFNAIGKYEFTPKILESPIYL